MTDGYVSYGSMRTIGQTFNQAFMTIQTNQDDGKMVASTNTLSTSGVSGLDGQGAAGGRPVWGYYRFQLPQNLPANATIKKAMIRLYGRDNTSNLAGQYLIVTAQDSANAPQITSANQIPGGSSGATTVATGSTWGAPTIEWKLDDWNESPNLKEVIVNLKNNQSGLTAGSYIQIYVTRANPYSSTTPPLLSADTTNNNISSLLGLVTDATLSTTNTTLVNVGLNANLLSSLGVGNTQVCLLGLVGVNCATNYSFELNSEDNSQDTLNHAQLMIEWE